MTVERVPLPRSFPVGLEFDLPLWDKRPEEWLRKEEKKGKWAFERGFRQKAPREEDRLFGDLTNFLVYGVTLRDFVSEEALRFSGFDPAGEKRVGNALVTAALVERPTVRRVIVGADLWRGSYREGASRIAVANERHRFALLLVENVALQGAYIELIRTVAPHLPVDGFLTGQNKAHIELGVPGLETQIRTGMWMLCMDDPYETGSPLSEHDADCACPYHELIADLNSYPSPGRTYDLLMALWFCTSAINRIDLAMAAAESAARPYEEDEGTIPESDIAGMFTP